MHYFNYGIGVYSGDMMPGDRAATASEILDTEKRTKLIEIENDRDAACVASVTVHGRVWQADGRSQSLLGQAIALASVGLPLPTVWRDANDSDMPITALSDLLAIAGAIAAQVQAAYSTSWARKAVVYAAATVSEVNAA